MEDVRSYASITKVISTTGQELECEQYLKHPEFSHENELCAQLHFSFIKYASNRSRSKCSEFRKVIELFLNFRQNYNRLNPLPLHLNSLSDLNVTIFRQFERFLQKENKEGRLKGRAVGALGTFKHALNFVAEHTNSIPVLRIPAIQYDRENKTEPFDDETSAELVAALKEHTDYLLTILENRARVHAALPYSFEELSNLVNPPVDQCNVTRWYQWALTAHTRKPNVAALNYWLERAEDPFLLELLKLSSTKGERLKAWHNYYEADGSHYLLDVPANPFGTHVKSLILDDYRALKTLLANGYPFGMSLDEIFTQFAYHPQFSFYERSGSVVQFLVRLYGQRWNTVKDANHRLSVDELLYKYYPSDMDMACLVIFMMLQTGWNKETVLAIDPENFEDALSGILSESEITIFSEKNRSQGNNLPYHDPKLFKATTDRANKYSAYNLIKLAHALSEPLAQQSFDWLASIDKENAISKLFLNLRNHGLWNQVGRFYTLSSESVFQTGVREFLTKYPVYENGRRLEGVKELTSKLRPTWFLKHRATKPLSLVALIQGHESSETTDLYYDSSGLAMKERYKRLRTEQEEIVNLLKQRKFSGLLGTAKTPTISNSELTIFYFPGHEKGLWGCSNRFAPDWPGFNQRVKPGQKCSPSTSCLFCSRCYIFEDSLPYLIDRYAQIEALLAEHEESDFSSTVKAERDIIDWLIMAWDDEEAVQKAFTYQQERTPLFPSDPALFEVLFDDSEITVK